MAEYLFEPWCFLREKHRENSQKHISCAFETRKKTSSSSSFHLPYPTKNNSKIILNNHSLIWIGLDSHPFPLSFHKHVTDRFDRSTPLRPMSGGKPAMLMCYLCGREFGTRSLPIHVPQWYSAAETTRGPEKNWTNKNKLRKQLVWVETTNQVYIPFI